MAKKRKDSPQPEPSKNKRKAQNSKETIRHWKSFEQCWASCVKNGSPVLMSACKAHLAAMGWLEHQEKWIDGMVHFGIKIED